MGNSLLIFTCLLASLLAKTPILVFFVQQWSRGELLHCSQYFYSVKREFFHLDFSGTCRTEKNLEERESYLEVPGGFYTSVCLSLLHFPLLTLIPWLFGLESQLDFEAPAMHHRPCGGLAWVLEQGVEIPLPTWKKSVPCWHLVQFQCDHLHNVFSRKWFL